MKIYKFATGFGSGDSRFSTSPKPPGTPEERANGVFASTPSEVFTVEDGRLIDRLGIDRGGVKGMIVWDENGHPVRL